MNFFRYNWTSHISWGEEECISHRICTGYPIRHKHGLHGQTSCDAYIPSHIGKTFDLMQSCLIQLTSKYINNMAILCSASWQCFIMLQGRWSPKLITCTKRPLKTDWKCGITIFCNTLIAFLTYLAFSFSKSWCDRIGFFNSSSTTIPGPWWRQWQILHVVHAQL